MNRSIFARVRNLRKQHKNNDSRASFSLESLESRQLLSASPFGDVDTPQTDPQTALIVPAVQKIREAAAGTQSVTDLLNPGKTTTVGLLLPAVQQVREAAARHQHQPNDPSQFKNPTPDPEAIALLLPAVQKVREAASKTREVADIRNPDENVAIGLLLPAVQQVREAATRQNSTTHERDLSNNNETKGKAMILPAVQDVRDSASKPPKENNGETK